MPDVSPFRAVRYARPSPTLVAPPYDVISPEESEAYRALDPHNVVHLTLDDDPARAGELFRSWLEEGVLVADDQPAVWAVAQEDTGPDGITRRREGLVASLRVEPYENGTVLPHERTHAGPKEGRLRLLREVRAQLEPIFLLYEGDPPVAVPPRDPDLAAAGTSLWRLDEVDLGDAFAECQLLIADGHHRYETALSYALEQGTPESARLMVVLVSTADPGLEVFATHRVFAGRPEIVPTGETMASLEQGLELLASAPRDRGIALAHTARDTVLVRGDVGTLDVELVEQVGQVGISYTPDRDEAVGRVERGEADIAFLVRPLQPAEVFARARRGEVLPPKTTYFYPKLTSGLLFHPL